MFIKDDYDFSDLKDACWSGAVKTLELVEEQDAEDELMSWLEEVFDGEMPTLMQVNDYLRFEAEEDLWNQGILSAIEDEDDDEDEEDEDDELDCSEEELNESIQHNTKLIYEYYHK